MHYSTTAKTYTVASLIVRHLADAPDQTLTRNVLRKRIGTPQRPLFDPALDMLAANGDVRVTAYTYNSTPAQKITLLRPPAPEPHCPTCTCHDVL